MKKNNASMSFVLAFTVATIATTFLMVSYPESSIKTIPTFTIERQDDGQWEISVCKLPDTTIIDTVNIDGIITYHKTEYLQVTEK
jgi:hypothetical protein